MLVMAAKNYSWLEKKQITAYIKHPNFDRNQHEKTKTQYPYSADKLTYDSEKDQ